MNAHTKRLAQRRKLNQQIAEQDAANRCGYCRLELPRLGAVLAILSGQRRFCSDDCLESYLEAESARERAEARR